MYKKQIKKHVTLEYKDGKSLFPELEDDKQTSIKISNNVYVSNKYLDDYKFENIYIGRLFLYLLNIGTTYLKLKLGDAFDNLFKKNTTVQDFVEFMETYIIDSGPLNLKIQTSDILQAIHSKDINRIYKTLEYLSTKKLRYDNFEEVKDHQNWQEWIKKFEFVHTNFASQVFLSRKDSYLYVSINLGYIAFYNFILGKYGYSKDSIEKIVNIRNKNDLSIYLFLLPKCRFNKYTVDIKFIAEIIGLDIDKCKDSNCITSAIKSIIGRLNKNKILCKDIEFDFVKNGRKISSIVFNFKDRKENKSLEGKLFDILVSDTTQIDEKIKDNIYNYFSKLVDDKENINVQFINSLVSNLIDTKLSTGTFATILNNLKNKYKEKITVNQVFKHFEIIRTLNELKTSNVTYSADEYSQFIYYICKNNRDTNYLIEWINYIKYKIEEIQNPKAYLLKVLKDNVEPVHEFNKEEKKIDNPLEGEVITLLSELYNSDQDIIRGYKKTVGKLVKFLEKKNLSVEEVKERLKEYRQQENSNIHLDIDGLVSGRKVKATVGLHSDNFLSQFENLD